MAKARRDSNETLDSRLTTLETGKHVLSAFKNGAFSFSSNTNELVSLDGYDADRSRGITVSGNSISFSKKGIYKVTTNARYLTDVWHKTFMTDLSGNVIGDSTWAGGNTAAAGHTFMVNISAPGVYNLRAYASSPGMTIQAPAPAGSPLGGVVRTYTLVIEEM